MSRGQGSGPAAAITNLVLFAGTIGCFALAARRHTRHMAAEAENREATRAGAYNRRLIEASLDPLVTIGPDGKIADANAAAETMTGIPRLALIGTDFSDYFTEPEKARAGYQLAFQVGAVRDYALELRHRDGHRIPVLYNASVFRDVRGHVVGVFAAARDISRLKRAEREIRRLADLQAVVAELGQMALRSGALNLVLDEAVRCITQALNVDSSSVLELIPGDDSLLLRAGMGWKEGFVGEATVEGGGDTYAGFTLRSSEPVVVEDLRREQRFSASPLHSAHEIVSGVSVVISTTRGPYGILSVHSRQSRIFAGDEVTFLQAIAGVLGSAIDRHRSEMRIRRINRAHSALSGCNQALLHAIDESRLLEQICTVIVRHAGYRLCWVGRAEHDEDKSVRPVAQAGFENGYLETVNISWADTERGRGPTGTCIRTGRPVQVWDIATDVRMTTWRTGALKRGYASSIALPLFLDSTVFGALNIYAAEAGAFDEREVELLTELANDLTFGITVLRTKQERLRAEEEIRALNAELEQRVEARTADLQAATAALEQTRDSALKVGLRIQQMLLLDRPPRDLPGVGVAAFTMPSQQIDGDFYYFFRHGLQGLDLVVGDVMGKGVPAALLGAATKSHFPQALSQLLAGSAHGTLPEPREIVGHVHDQVTDHLISLDSFVTLCYVRLDLEHHRVILVDCGHNLTLHFHQDTGIGEMVEGDNLPLGFSEHAGYEQKTIAFEHGDALVIYSDGLTGAQNPAGEPFGSERLLACVERFGRCSADDLTDRIRAAVVSFAGSTQFTDDLTCVVLKREVQEAEAPLAHDRVEMSSNLQDLAQARAFVRRFCGNLVDAPPDEASIGLLELAVNEAASNIIKHAYAGRSDRHIQIEMEAFTDRIVIQLHHQGTSFDVAAAEAPVFDASRDHGFGLYLIAHSVDEVRYGRDEAGDNHIQLIKKRGTGGG